MITIADETERHLFEEGLSFDSIPLSQFKKLIEKQGYFFCRIISDSMMPLIQLNDRARIEPVGPVGDLKPFDIIVFFDGERLNCHFLWKISSRGDKHELLTRSLKNPHSNDLPITAEHLLGKVTNFRINRWIRFWILFRTRIADSQ